MTRITVPARTAQVPKILLAGGILLGLYLALAIFAPAIAPYGYQTFHVEHALEAPTLKFLAGTDQYGRDVLSRVIWGARSTILIALPSTILGVGVGVAIGLFTGFVRGVADEVIMRGVDVMMAIPALLLAMLILTSLGSHPALLVLAIALIFVPRTARVVRGVVLGLASAEFIDAARVRGEGVGYILFRELLPNAWAPIIVEASMRFGYAILLAAALGFLGLGVTPPSPDWGLMVSEGLNFLAIAPWMVVVPGFAIASAVIGVNLLGEGLRLALGTGDAGAAG